MKINKIILTVLTVAMFASYQPQQAATQKTYTEAEYNKAVEDAKKTAEEAKVKAENDLKNAQAKATQDAKDHEKALSDAIAKGEITFAALAMHWKAWTLGVTGFGLGVLTYWLLAAKNKKSSVNAEETEDLNLQ